jgi:hypothetical protein
MLLLLYSSKVRMSQNDHSCSQWQVLQQLNLYAIIKAKPHL